MDFFWSEISVDSLQTKWLHVLRRDDNIKVKECKDQSGILNDKYLTNISDYEKQRTLKMKKKNATDENAMPS